MPREPEASEWGVSAADEEALVMFGFATGGASELDAFEIRIRCYYDKRKERNRD